MTGGNRGGGGTKRLANPNPTAPFRVWYSIASKRVVSKHHSCLHERYKLGVYHHDGCGRGNEGARGRRPLRSLNFLLFFSGRVSPPPSTGQ